MLNLFKKKNNKKGFTLVELVVVIAILGILAAIIVPQLLGFQDRAKAQADKQSGVQIRNALALLNANGEITLSDGGTYTVDSGKEGTGDTATGTAVVGINTKPIPGGTDGAGVQALVETLTGAVTVQGPKDIIVTVKANGEIVLTSP